MSVLCASKSCKPVGASESVYLIGLRMFQKSFQIRYNSLFPKRKLRIHPGPGNLRAFKVLRRHVKRCNSQGDCLANYFVKQSTKSLPNKLRTALLLLLLGLAR